MIIQHNNTLAFSRVSDSASNDGVIVEGLSEALVNHPELVQQYFMTEAVTVDEHRLTALHTALVNGGSLYTYQKMLLLSILFNM